MLHTGGWLRQRQVLVTVKILVWPGQKMVEKWSKTGGHFQQGVPLKIFTYGPATTSQSSMVDGTVERVTKKWPRAKEKKSEIASVGRGLLHEHATLLGSGVLIPCTGY